MAGINFAELNELLVVVDNASSLLEVLQSKFKKNWDLLSRLKASNKS